MANIKKSFNFRNGVQVDDDNLKVSATGLVGIGTTVPTEALDVRGNLVVSGVSSAISAQAGVMTVTTLNPTEIIGAGVSIVSGIVTASSGIVTFYGDARFLQGMPTSQWEDTNTGLGVSSIYNTGGNVGIATSNPQSTIQVGTNPDVVGGKGVGISSVGNINASGIVTATTFKGDVTGNVSGNVTGDVTGNADTATTLETARTIGGVSFNGSSNINLPGVNVAGNQDTSGTAANLSGTPNILINNLSAAGVSTFSGNVDIPDNTKINLGDNDELQLYHLASGESILYENGSGNFNVLANHIKLSTQAATVQLETTGSSVNIPVNLDVDGHTNLDNVSVAGVTTFAGDLHAFNILASGIVTSTTYVSNFRVGIGTNQPLNDIQVRKSGDAEIQVTSDGGIAGITVGREPGTNNTNNAELRYGGGSGTPYSSAQSLDILNYGTGNFNYHLSANNAGAVAGDFHWHRGKNNARLMTLTGIGGSLGIGITTPTQALHVAGNGFIAGNLTVDDTLIASSLSVNSTVNFSNIICGTVAGTVLGNTNSTSGISTFNRLKTTSSTSNFAGIGIKTDNTSSLPFDLYGDGSSSDTRVFITANGRIGIQTSTIDNGVDISAVTSRATISSVGIGTTNPQSAVDMRFAGKELTGIFANRMYMLPPMVNTAQRNALQGVVSGAIIYNTSQNKLQVYIGTGNYNTFNWQDLH